MPMLLIALLPVLLMQSVIDASVQLVPVGVVVRDKNGPVAGLTPDDFTITDSGKPQRIVVFTAWNAKDGKQETSRGPMPPNVVSNFVNSAGDVPQNVTAILFDLMNSSSGQEEAIKQLVAYLRTIRETDRVGLFVLGYEPHAIQDFTGDPNVLRRAAERLKELDEARIEVTTQAQLSTLLAPPPIKNSDGSLTFIGTSGLASKVSVPTAADRASATADAFEGIARHLSGLPGRKSLVWIATASPFTSTQSKDDSSSPLNRALAALNDANVAIYPVEPQMPTGAEAEAMKRFASLTGGSVSSPMNDLTHALAAAVADSRINYTLMFAPDQKFDGKPHDLKVKVSGNYVDISYPSAYRATPKPMPEKERKEVLNELLSSDVNSSQIGLIVSADPEPSVPGSFNVTISVEVANTRSGGVLMTALHLEQKGDRRVGQLSLAMQVESSKSKGPQLGSTPINFTEEQFQNALKRGFVIRQTVRANGPNDRVRIVVQDQSTGLAGAVWLPLRTN
jgi:VWFA-related protein